MVHPQDTDFSVRWGEWQLQSLLVCEAFICAMWTHGHPHTSWSGRSADATTSPL